MSGAVLVRPRQGLSLGPAVAGSEVIGRRVRRLTLVGVVALAALNAADAVTTHLVLAHASAGAVEANPLVLRRMNATRVVCAPSTRRSLHALQGRADQP